MVSMLTLWLVYTVGRLDIDRLVERSATYEWTRSGRRKRAPFIHSFISLEAIAYE